MALRSMDTLNVRGRRVLLRLDLNVPLKEGKVLDDTRVREAAPTVRALAERDAVVVACSHQVPDLRPILCIKERCRDRPIPSLHYAVRERIFLALHFSIVRKHWLISRQESPHQNQVSLLVQADPHHLQPLRRVLLCQLIQHRVLVPARLAPRRPERHYQGLPFVFRQQLLVTLRVDHRWIFRRHARLREPQHYSRHCQHRCEQNLPFHASPYPLNSNLSRRVENLLSPT